MWKQIVGKSSKGFYRQFLSSIWCEVVNKTLHGFWLTIHFQKILLCIYYLFINTIEYIEQQKSR